MSVPFDNEIAESWQVPSMRGTSYKSHHRLDDGTVVMEFERFVGHDHHACRVFISTKGETEYETTIWVNFAGTQSAQVHRGPAGDIMKDPVVHGWMVEGTPPF